MRVLIIRFSSFGDIFQALEAANHLSTSGEAEFVDWIVREDFAPLLQNQKSIRKVFPFSRKSSVFNLMKVVWRLAVNYDHVYDAHSNLRSLVVCSVIRAHWFCDFLINPLGQRRSIIRRSKERTRRLLFFKFRLPTLPMPYRGAESFVRPLRKWIPDLEFSFARKVWTPPELPTTEIFHRFRHWRRLSPDVPLIALAPSAAWPNKRWPVGRWRLFVQQWIESSKDSRFLLLGGPDDSFLNEIEREFGSERIFNAVGKTSLLESAILLSEAHAIVANDTGLLHVADRLQMPNVGIIGPTAFGYTVSPVAQIAEVPRSDLACKPCSKDGRNACTNAVHLKCLIDVSPELVVRKLNDAFKSAGESLE